MMMKMLKWFYPIMKKNNYCHNKAHDLDRNDEVGGSLLEKQNEDDIKVTTKTTFKPKVVKAMKNCKLCMMKMPTTLWSKRLKKKLQNKL